MKKLLLKSEKSTLLMFLLMVASISRGQSTQTYTTTSTPLTFVAPAGVTTIKVESYGGGGGGARGGLSNKQGGGGGGGGGYAVNNTVTVVPGTSYPITIGGGGSGSSSGNGANGTSTNFNSTIAIATGGGGGRAFSGSTGIGGTAGTGTRAGGVGGTGTASGSGGGGGAAGTLSVGAAGTVTTGGLNGGGMAGNGGVGTALSAASGAPGNVYGGGGGGGTKTSGGGNGSGGYMVITYTCPTYDLSATTSTGPYCGATAALIDLKSATTSLPEGTYTVTYNLSGATSATGSTATMIIATGDDGNGSFTTSSLNVGNTTVTVTNIASSYCSTAVSTNNSIVVATYNTPTVNAGTAITTCETSGSTNITAGASAINATSVSWTTTGTGVLVNPGTTAACTYTPSAADIVAGTVTFTLTAYNPGCGSVSSNKTLTIRRVMTVAAGTNVTTCSGAGAVNITAGSSATNHTTATWTSSGSGAFANATSLTLCTYNPSAADISSGSVTLTLTTTNGGCPPVTSTKTFIINGTATAVAGTAIITCATAGAVNITAGSSATNYSSVLWTSNGTGVFANANSLTTCTYTPSPADILAGTRTLTLTAYGNSPCANVTSNKTITISNVMTVFAGVSFSACSSGAIGITTGSTATNHTLVTWTSSGSGTFANANSLTTCTYTASAADITSGSVILTLTASNGGCANVTSNKTLTIIAPPTSVAGSTINTCSSTGAVNITTGSSATNQSSVAWSGGAGTFTNPNSLTLCSYTPSAAENTAGSTITLTLTAFGNSPCSSVTSTKSLVISRAMTAVAGTNITMCYPTTTTVSISGGATATNHTSVTWSSSGTGTFTNPNSLGACSYTPSAADVSAGSVTLTLTATNNGCPPAVSTKTLTISSFPTAVAGPALTTCTAYGSYVITGGATATNQTSVLWTSSGTGALVNASSLTACTYNPSAADITAGSVTLTLTAYGASPCGNATSTKTLTITQSVTVTGTTPGSRTGAGTVLLGATASGGILNWYAAASGGTALGTGTSFTTPSIAATTTFYVEAVNGVCASSPRTAVIATVNYTEIDILGNATSIVAGDTTPATADWTDFGTNSTRTFTINNLGFSALNIGAITFSGANASEFTVTTPPSPTIAIGGSTTFVVTFAPTALGIRTADISIVNNDNDESPYDFSLQGTGVEQEMDVKGNAVTIVDGDVSPSTSDWTDFSTVAGTRTYTIYNTGNIALTIGAITVGGTNAGDFSVTTLPASVVPANSSTTFVVTFAPTAINSRTATISIVNNDNNENPYNFAIQGFGIIPEIDIQGNATSISDSTIPAATTANWTDFSSTFGTRTFTIYNNGNIALTVGAITFTGTNASEFTVTTPPAGSVAAFSTTTFVVRFLPTALGVRTAQIHIVTNDSNENPYDFNLQGTGVPREIDLQGLGLSIANNDLTTSVNDGTDFGPADINLATVTRTFTIINTGSLALTISNPTITGTNPGDFSITANPGTLSIGAGGSTTFQVTFNPTAVFTRSARINIVNDDSDENPYIFAIQGSGLLDNDGDGVENNADQDDDNDGIIDTIECGTCVSDPFVNGSFETPVIGAATYSIEPSANVNGWNNSAENFIEIWSTGFNGVPSAAGNQFAELNANVAGNLYQTFCLNGAGGTINWAIKHRGRSGTDTAEVRFGATLGTVATVATMTDGNTSWGSYSGTYSIPVGQTQIVLAFTAVSSTGGLSYGNFIDDVQIIINQNCIDTDGDTIADLLDVDDDNDGIPDVEEAGFKIYSNNTGTMDKTSTTTWKDLNANGINDYIDTMISGATYLLPDTDGDTVPNYLDLDSDNDSLWDVDEANLVNGDGDINDDGKGDLLDSEGDGLLNLFDNSAVFGSAFRAYAQDSDLNGISDYLQLDSNDDGTNDIQTSLYGSFDTNGDGKIDGTGDTDNDGILDIFDTNDIVRGSPRDLNRKLYLDFDGRNDYAEDSAMLGGLSNASLMAFIDLNPAFSGTGIVVGQDKFHIQISSAKTLQAVVNGTTLTYGTPLNTAQWYHVAATYNGGLLTLYLNGKSVANVALSGAIAADATKLTLGRSAAYPGVGLPYYFKGKIDEVRIFNVALTSTQLERMVYQEIQNTASQVRGLIVPKDVGSLPFANVLKYYRMDAYKDDIVDNLTTASIDTGTGMKLYNHKVLAVQEAPLPFTTVRTGTFADAVHDTTRDIRGLDVLDFDYSIIQVKHNITETANSTDLALFIDPGVTVSMTNDTKLQNDWYLKLDGKIDLVGKSQLIQTTLSDLDVTSAGSLERDQQGQSNKFNYNYWSSPVSTINSTTINHGFTVAGVMKDGTNVSSPQSLLWTTGVNGSPTSPITLSSYWIFKFQNSTNSYSNWASAGQNGTLLPGQGYTMKGAGAATSNQNYTFVGKPNSGIITSTVGAGNLNLCGNPYPSAIDADKFIDDNAATIKGTLYLWEHYSSNYSHNTIQYQGGYATYTKTGGTAPVAPAGVSGLGTSSKIAKRFIPVGQGFFVTGSVTGGTITFNNGQRLFIKEDDAVNSYSLFRTNNSTVVADTNPLMNNAQDDFIHEDFMKLHLGYNATDNLHRQTLIGFMNENATAGYDNGYDGLSIETLTNDMYFINGTDKLNISGEGFFNVNSIYPIGVKNATSGNVTFVVDNKENFEENQEIYIYDSVTSTYNSIKSQSYEVNLPAGTYETRFSLRFTNGTDLGTVDNEQNRGIAVTHSQSNNMINIKNPLQEVTVKSVALFNLLGQKVTEWKIDNQDQADIQLHVANISTGTYIVKVITDSGAVTKKILVKN
jgi:hypothetical protein